MSTNKTDKELAYLHDLYVAPDWGERFAELLDAHVKPPREGRALYVAAGTGGHALALAGRAGKGLTVICVDESDERVALARAKAASLKGAAGERVEFRAQQLETLDFEDEQFDLVLGDASLIAPERLPEVLAEMARVAAPGAIVAFNVTTASSFGEFYSVFWEALTNTELEEHAGAVESLIQELPTVADVERLASIEALEQVESWTNREEFDFATAAEFLAAPLVEHFLLDNWLAQLPEEGDERERVLAEVARIIDEERQGGDFTLSIKATLVVGRKAD